MKEKSHREKYIDKLKQRIANPEDTPERDPFWKSIFYGEFTPFYNCKVVNFKLKEKSI